MKHILTLLLALCPLLSPAENIQWTSDFSTLASAETYTDKYAPVPAPMAIGCKGTVFLTGRFDLPFLFGDKLLEPVATSAYLAAMDDHGTPLWCVGLLGACRITTVTTDEEENVYVAGLFADDVIAESTDGTSQTLTGSTDTHEMANAFLACYSSTGQLKAIQTIVLSKNSALASKEAYEFDSTFRPVSLGICKGRVWLAARFGGTFTMEGLTRTSGYINGMGVLYDAVTLEVLSFSQEDLGGVREELCMQNTTLENATGNNACSICLACDTDEVYVALISTGSATLTMGSTSQEISAGTDVYCSLIAQPVSGKVSNLGQHTGDRYWYANEVNAMQVQGDKLYLAGTQSSPLAFSPAQPDLWCDQWTSCLSKEDFSLCWSTITGAQKADMATTNEKYRYTIGAALLPTGKWFSIGSVAIDADEQGGITCITPSYYLGVASNGTLWGTCSRTSSGSQTDVQGLLEDGLSSIPQSIQHPQPAYNLQGIRIDASQLSNQKGIKIIGGKKYR